MLGSFPQRRPLAGARGTYHGVVARRAEDLPDDMTLVVVDDDRNISASAFSQFLDNLFAGPPPELTALDAADSLRAVRAEAGQ